LLLVNPVHTVIFIQILYDRSDETKKLKCGGDYTVCLKCSYSEKMVATCSNSKVLKIWDTSSWACTGTRYVYSYTVHTSVHLYAHYIYVSIS